MCQASRLVCEHKVSDLSLCRDEPYRRAAYTKTNCRLKVVLLLSLDFILITSLQIAPRPTSVSLALYSPIPNEVCVKLLLPAQHIELTAIPNPWSVSYGSHQMHILAEGVIFTDRPSMTLVQACFTSKTGFLSQEGRCPLSRQTTASPATSFSVPACHAKCLSYSCLPI